MGSCRAKLGRMKVRPLTPHQAKRTLTNRLVPIVDKVRQLNTQLGQRSLRVFLVWTQWTGPYDGDGDPVEVARLEILPTPKVEGIGGVGLTGMSAGVLPVGSIRVTEVSAALTEGQLRGLYCPQAGVAMAQPDGTMGAADHLPPRTDFFYEVVEDGRTETYPIRQKYRLADQPRLNEGNVCWELGLERVSEDNSRDGSPRYGEGA